MPDSAYNEQLAAARSRFINGSGIPARQMDRLVREFAVMLARIVRDGEAGRITEARRDGLILSIMEEMQRYSDRVVVVLDESVMAAAEAAAAGHANALSAASTVAGITRTHSFTSVPIRAIEGLMQRRGLSEFGGIAETYQTLMRRKLQDIAPEVDRFIASAFTRGQSAETATAELAKIMAQNDPAILDTLGKLGPRGGRTRAAIRSAEVIDDADLVKAKQLLSDSRRIMRTEINTGYHESNVLGMMESPVVRSVRWQTSGRHEGLHSSPDVCTVLRDADIYGLGPGMYPPELVPSLPHPNCGCRGVAVLLRPADWDKPKPEVPDVRFADESQVRAVVGDGVTDNYIQRQMEMMNTRLRLADEAYRQVQVAA